MERNNIIAAVSQAAEELIAAAKPEQGDLLIVGCSSSEIVGAVIGHGSSAEAKQRGYEIVNVLPQPHAGGSWSVACWSHFTEPVVVEAVKAELGMDIGDTLIGMHLRAVAVPVRTSVRSVGEANLVCARTRPKFVGGSRAVYPDGDVR